MPLNPNGTALIIVDMQNYFAHPEGPRFEHYENAIIENPRWLIWPIQKLIASAHNHSMPVVFLFFSIDSLYLGSNQLEAEKSRWYEQLIDELAPSQDDLVLRKDENDGFSNPVLDLYLKEKGVTNVLICGLMADECVKVTALSAAERGYHVVVVMDAVFPDLTEAQYPSFLKTNFRKYTMKIPPVFVYLRNIIETPT